MDAEEDPELMVELEKHGFVNRQSSHSGGDGMKESARYVKIVEWSDEDQCFVGICPGLLSGGCHVDDELTIFEQLCAAVDEVIDLYKQDGKPLPPPTSGRDFASKILSVA